MRIGILCTLTLLTLTASFASAQSITRCGGPTNALYINWPTFQFDVCHTGYNAYETKINTGNVGSLTMAWWAQTNDTPTAFAPVLVNGVVYFATTDGTVYAVRSGAGSAIWQNPLFVPVVSSLTVANGMVYVPIGNNFGGGVVALNSQTGSQTWAYSSDGRANGTTLDNNRLYFTTWSGRVIAINATTGKELWSTPRWFSYAYGQVPAVVNGLVYVADDNQGLVAYNEITGSLLWRTQLQGGADPVYSPAVFDGIVYVGVVVNNVGGGLQAVDALSGKLLWTSPWHFENSPPVVAGGTVYVGSIGGVGALDAKTGSPLWFASYQGGENFDSLAVANGVLYAGTSLKNLYGINASTGSLLWTYPFSNAEPAPIVANGNVYVGLNSGNNSQGGVMAFHLPN